MAGPLNWPADPAGEEIGVYPWIWRRLPGGRAAKLAAFALLVAAAVAVLWFVLFPLVDRLLPFDDVTVE